ncbi:MAG: 4-(cytidine 5'-diphospho)-2-C-methyl-D-erythritol kinase [Spiribacter sp.]|jgi:4-diphosphocytidyl-2-C-methyl-D-erythritol kinase|nr:4-(cytidine 5'-diphospho)-2-C-methyl-D-erythritol kinase [Spiribacter sp.]
MSLSSAWPAPAKINRFLHITGRRADGYHTLQTVFQFLALCDWLDFEILDVPDVLRDGGLPGLALDDDLTVRAARALQQAGGISQGVRIRLDKRIPAGGGLGGGSSDAATTLVALNALWRCGLTERELAAMALRLGADVPVFVGGQAAWAEGVGESLTPVEVDCPWLVVVDPGVSVDTRSVFCDPKLTRHGAHITIRGFKAGEGRNDCEAVVRRQHPAVARALDRLGEWGPTLLTGTGGCLFARFDDRERASMAAREVGKTFQAWVCQAVNRSPLLDRLEAERHL